MTMDVVWNGAYGIDIDFQNNPNFPFFVRTMENFKNISDFNLFFKFMGKIKKGVLRILEILLTIFFFLSLLLRIENFHLADD
jgi:hypothetical protein